MKRSFLLLFFILNFFALNAQTFHNYFNPNYGYVQIGFGGRVIQFRYPNGSPFTTLNIIGTQNSLTYYGDNSFQVAVNSNSSQVYVINSQGTVLYNYVGPVPTPNPYGSTPSSYKSNNVTSKSKSKCPWCNGTGRITRDDHVTQYGINNYIVTERCKECGREFISTYTNHYHLDCAHCGGTGYIMR